MNNEFGLGISKKLPHKNEMCNDPRWDIIILYNSGYHITLWTSIGEEIILFNEVTFHISQLLGKLSRPFNIGIMLESIIFVL